MTGAPRAVLAGIFVGGRGTRMGGAAKGLLEAPEGGTLLDRWARLLAAAGIDAVLVGRHPAYADAGLEVLEDAPPGIGPLGGLIALLERAAGGPALAVACDMPFVSAELVGRLLAAPGAPVLAPRREGLWEPLCARYDGAVLPVARRRAAAEKYALQGLLADAGATELPLAPHELAQLRDWDTPSDLL